MRLRSSPVALAIVLATAAVSPALADEAAESYLRDFVAAIDAAPDYRASFEALSTAPGTGATLMRGLSIESTTPGLSITIDTIEVVGFGGSGGSFAADALRIDGARMTATEYMTVEMASAEFRDFVLPSNEGFVWDDAQPYLSVIRLLSPLTGIEMSSGRIASVAMLQRVDGVESRVSYEQVNIDGWSGGRIASISAGPIRSQTPDQDQLMAMSIGSAHSRDIDLNVVFHVFDPANYPNEIGDRVWHQVLARTVYRDWIMAVPGVTITMKEASLDNVRLRQPAGGIGILTEFGTREFGDLEDEPEAAARFFEVLTSYGFDSFTMTGLAVDAPGVTEFSVAGISFSDISSDLLGEFAFDRLAVSVPEQGTATVRRFAFGDIVPPSIEAIIAAIKAEEEGEEVDVAAVSPTLGFIDIAGVDVEIADMPRTTLERFRLDLRDYVGPVPTTVGLDLIDANLDLDLIEDPDAREMLAALGYERAIVDVELRARWTDAGRIAVDSFKLGMDNLGSVSGDLEIVAVPPTDYMALADEAVLEELEFVKGSITLKDDSIVGRGLAMQAAQLGVDAEAFREQFAMGLPFMLAFLGDPQLQMELAPVLQQFIKVGGGSLTMVANPAAPQNVMLLVASSMASPFELVQKLKLTFSGIPGDPDPVQPIPAEAGSSFDEASPEPQSPGQFNGNGDGGAPSSPGQFGEPGGQGGSDGDSGTQFD